MAHPGHGLQGLFQPGWISRLAVDARAVARLRAEGHSWAECRTLKLSRGTAQRAARAASARVKSGVGSVTPAGGRVVPS